MPKKIVAVVTTARSPRITLQRAPVVTPAMMVALSKGEDSKIVTGDITVLWRTAEAQEQKQGQPGGKGK